MCKGDLLSAEYVYNISFHAKADVIILACNKATKGQASKEIKVLAVGGVGDCFRYGDDPMFDMALGYMRGAGLKVDVTISDCGSYRHLRAVHA